MAPQPHICIAPKSGEVHCTSDCARVADRLLERGDMPYMYWNAAYQSGPPALPLIRPRPEWPNLEEGM